jgi:hypothetical protein
MGRKELNFEEKNIQRTFCSEDNKKISGIQSFGKLIITQYPRGCLSFI